MKKVKQMLNWSPQIDFYYTLLREWTWVTRMSEGEFEEWIKRPRY
jgi:hypothetical protein